MFFYWLLFFAPALAILSPMRGSANLQRLLWYSCGALFTLTIGLRYQVGGDWDAYLGHYEQAFNTPFLDALRTSDPGYAFLNWLSGLIDGEVYLVNLICGAVFMIGTITFCRQQPSPWMALLVAVPYLTIVVAMGYTRQSVAIGFELLALTALSHGRTWRFIYLIGIGALFHKTVLVLLPFALLTDSRGRLWNILLIVLTSSSLVVAIMAEHYEALFHNYVDAQMTSDGGPIRVVMNSLPSMLLVLFKEKLTSNKAEARIWVWMALFSLAFVPLISIASTAVDRIAIYFIPIQIFVFSRVHRIFSDRMFRAFVIMCTIIGYGTVQWIWLNHATHAFAWLPYQIYPFTDQ